MEEELSAVERFWARFDAVRGAAGNPSAHKISKEVLQHLDREVAEATIRGWIRHEYLPRDDQDFISVITLLRARRPHVGNGRGPRAMPALPRPEAEAWLAAWQSARAAAQSKKQPPPRERVEPQPPADVTETAVVAGEHVEPGPRPRPIVVAGMAIAALVTTIVIVIVIVATRPDPATSGNGRTAEVARTDTGYFPTNAGPLPGGGPMISCPPPANQPDSIAEADNHAAHAEYYRKAHLFLVYDNRNEGDSAILELTIPDVHSTVSWYNSKGWTCNGRNRPFAMVVAPHELQEHHTVQYRVCTGEVRNIGRRPLEHCGPPVTDRPAGR